MKPLHVRYMPKGRILKFYTCTTNSFLLVEKRIIQKKKLEESINQSLRIQEELKKLQKQLKGSNKNMKIMVNLLIDKTKKKYKFGIVSRYVMYILWIQKNQID